MRQNVHPSLYAQNPGGRILAFIVAAIAAGLGLPAGAVDIPDPIAWFNMDSVSGNVVTDASGNNRSLTLESGVTVVDDSGFRALSFNGTTNASAKFTCPAVTNTTVAFWSYRNAVDALIINDQGQEQNVYPYLFTGHSGLGINWTRGSSGTSTGLNVIYVQNTQQKNTSFSLPRSKWHHVAFTTECSGSDPTVQMTCKVYVDGVKTSETSWTNDKAMRTASQLVILGNQATRGNRPLWGKMADIRFYDTTLTADQIAVVAAQGFPDKKLVMHYKFDEKTGNTTPEAIGGGSMTLGSNVTLSDDGVEGRALAFYGSTNLYAQSSTPAYPILENTIAVWVRRSSRGKVYNAIVANPYPRLFASGIGSAVCSDLGSDGRKLSVAPAVPAHHT